MEKKCATMEEDEQERKNCGKVMYVTSSQKTSMHNESKIMDSIKQGCSGNPAQE